MCWTLDTLAGLYLAVKMDFTSCQLLLVSAFLSALLIGGTQSAGVCLQDGKHKAAPSPEPHLRECALYADSECQRLSWNATCSMMWWQKYRTKCPDWQLGERFPCPLQWQIVAALKVTSRISPMLLLQSIKRNHGTSVDLWALSKSSPVGLLFQPL